jgi:Zn-dependent metalloprotease
MKFMKYSVRQNYFVQATILTIVIAIGGQVLGQEQNTKKLENQAISNLKTEFGDRVAIRRARATNKVNFVRLDPRSSGGLTKQGLGMTSNEKLKTFLMAYGPIFGLQDPENELSMRREKGDELGGSHLTYDQYYNGVPVFGGVLIAHFDNAGDLRSVNGTVAPYIKLDTKPDVSRESASATAALAVAAEFLSGRGLKVTAAALRIYRIGMAQGVAGENHLVWQVEVGNNRDVRKLVFVDAHSGEIVDQMSGVYDARDRRIYDSLGIFDIPASYLSGPFWREGFGFPTGDPRADEIIAAEGETYDFYRMAFGRDSYDGGGSPMISFFNLPFENAYQIFLADGNFAIVLGDGLISDDIVGHEWTHAVTATTDGLVYAYQPGALNEAYSDIFGETIDQINGRGLDSPGGTRGPNNDACSIFSTPTDVVRVSSPNAIAGDYDAMFNQFADGSPELTTTGITGQIVEVNDGIGIGSDGCSTPFVNPAAIQGKIALIDASVLDGGCSSLTKVENAELNGAQAVILANDSSIGEVPSNFGCRCLLISIPVVDVGETTGDKIRSQLGTGVTASIFSDPARNRDNSYKWLIAEDTGHGAIRDMWNPTCYFNPGRVSDDEYYCADSYDLGVHENSGIPNHTFALLVDGGNYNGQRVTAIGLTKAAHIYFRAMTVYQVPFTDFADHAEALEASAQDLLGRNLADLKTGLPSGEKIDGNDLKQLHAATRATELREPPTQCNFRPLLGKNPPDDSCSLPRTSQSTIFADSFDGNPSVRWSVTREVASTSTFRGGNWSWVHNLPDGRRGSGFFAYDFPGGCGLPDPSQNGVLELASPAIRIPDGLASGPHLSFDHWVALEAGFDGAQLMISVNGGPFQLVDPSAFIYNGYNSSLLPFPYTDNVRAGQPAFTGTDAGSVKGSWGTSIVDLSGYAHSGDTIRLRFDMSTDFCFGTGLGWYLDNVRVYACDNTRNQ